MSVDGDGDSWIPVSSAGFPLAPLVPVIAARRDGDDDEERSPDCPPRRIEYDPWKQSLNLHFACHPWI
jgi:hypothetical protein